MFANPPPDDPQATGAANDDKNLTSSMTLFDILP